jgi:hypothetical protein
MHKAVELVLKRMESNPDEFVTRGAGDRWSSILARYKDFFTEEEAKELTAKHREIMMRVMHEEVMDSLLNSDENLRETAMQQLELQLKGRLKSKYYDQQRKLV